MSNSSSWSSTVVGADDEDPRRGNEVGGEAGAGKTREKKHMGKLELVWAGCKGREKQQLSKHKGFWKCLSGKAGKESPKRSVWDKVCELGDIREAEPCLERKLSRAVG